MISELATLLIYLSSTDWLVIRELETGVAMPADIKLKRAQARERISQLKEQ